VSDLQCGIDRGGSAGLHTWRRYEERMSDTSPRDQSALTFDAPKRTTVKKRRPDELLFEFMNPRGVRTRCFLQTDPEAGVDVQFFGDGHFMHSRRFDGRALAEAWAIACRQELEKLWAMSEMYWIVCRSTGAATVLGPSCRHLAAGVHVANSPVLRNRHLPDGRLTFCGSEPVTLTAC
jgi:hypothetical protein